MPLHLKNCAFYLSISSSLCVVFQNQYRQHHHYHHHPIPIVYVTIGILKQTINIHSNTNTLTEKDTYHIFYTHTPDIHISHIHCSHLPKNRGCEPCGARLQSKISICMYVTIATTTTTTGNYKSNRIADLEINLIEHCMRSSRTVNGCMKSRSKHLSSFFLFSERLVCECVCRFTSSITQILMHSQYSLYVRFF